MQVVPLTPVPAQNFQMVLGNQNCAIRLYTLDGYDFSDLALQTPVPNLYFDLAFNGVDVTTCAICLNQKRLLINRQYRGFVGDFVFVDTQGATDPEFAGLGSRYVLLYLEAADL